MRIVNAHVHLVDLEGMLREYPEAILPGNIAVYSEMDSILPLLAPETLLRQMDEAGVERSILYAVEAPIVYASNEYVHGICQRYPDRLIGFASVNPKDHDAPRKLERAVRELGLCGLKLHPPLQGFFPNDRAVFDVYRKCDELNIPVVFHVGSTPFGCSCRLAQAKPLLIDDVAVEFPNLRILLTHLGTMWHHEAFMVVEKNPNVFIDTAAYVTEIPQVLTPDMVERVGVDRIIFGTDYPTPYGRHTHRMAEFVECIRDLKLSDEAKRAIMGQNVDRLLSGGSVAPPVTVQEMARKLGPGPSGSQAE